MAMTNINIIQYPDNTFLIKTLKCSYSISLYWSDYEQQWTTHSWDSTFPILSFGNGPLPDWTSLIQFLLEYNN